MGSRGVRLVLALAALTLAAPRVSLAQSASDRETARSLMEDGDQRRDRKDFRGALERYLAADALVHATTTGLEVARAQVELGFLVEAREKLLDVSRIPPKPGDPPVLAQARATALSMGDALEPRIPGLRVAVRGATDTAKLSVQVDGVSIPPVALIAYRKLDPGRHSVVARYGTAEHKEDVTLKEAENKEVPIDFSSEAMPAGTALLSTPEPANPSARPWKALAIAGFGLAGAGVVVGSITGILAFTKASAAKSIPASQGGCVNDNCGPATDSDINASKLFGTVSTVSFIVAGAGVALGVTSLVAGRDAPKDSELRTSHGGGIPPTPPGIRVVPWWGLGAGGLSGTF